MTKRGLPLILLTVLVTGVLAHAAAAGDLEGQKNAA
jgi:hypothetical protein